MSEAFNKQYWRSRARRLRLFINFHWFLDAFFPAAFACLLLAAVALLAWKSSVLPLTGAQLAIAIIASLVITTGASIFVKRKYFHSTDDALCRLEFELGLNNALTLAQDGLAPFPPPDARKLKLFKGHYKRRSVPALVAFLLCAIITIAVPARSDKVKPLYVENLPAQFEAIQETLEELSSANVFDQEKLDALQAELDALKSKKSEEWFSAASLEAAATLEEMLSAGTEEIAAAANKISNALEEQALQNANSTDQSTAGNPLADPTLSETISALAQNNTLSLDPKTLAQLNAIKSKQNLSASAAKQLAESLKKAASACQNCNGKQCENPSGNAKKQLAKNCIAGTDGHRLEFSKCDGDGNAPNGSGSGTEGGGNAPLSYGNATTEKAEGESVNLTSQVETITLGEAFTTRAKPSKNSDSSKKTETVGTQSYGNAVEQNRTNAGAWSKKLTPEEREILRNAKK